MYLCGGVDFRYKLQRYGVMSCKCSDGEGWRCGWYAVVDGRLWSEDRDAQSYG